MKYIWKIMIWAIVISVLTLIAVGINAGHWSDVEDTEVNTQTLDDYEIKVRLSDGFGWEMKGERDIILDNLKVSMVKTINNNTLDNIINNISIIDNEIENRYKKQKVELLSDEEVDIEIERVWYLDDNGDLQLYDRHAVPWLEYYTYGLMLWVVISIFHVPFHIRSWMRKVNDTRREMIKKKRITIKQKKDNDRKWFTDKLKVVQKHNKKRFDNIDRKLNKLIKRRQPKKQPRRTKK